MTIRPNYNKIYIDLILIKFPERVDEFLPFLKEKTLSNLEVLTLNNRLFDSLSSDFSNGKHRAYDKNSILYILDYQKKNKLNNTQLANHFKLSRNSITKWKKIIRRECLNVKAEKV
ncbi:helix-turn-helix domain-containing protein [Chryseobacterium sp. HMWF035]|uniref:helix-turn-helix domain-containing protein n=1 Tax=Chryseobacterium sp. HMWF035 TaxID=2056868 RepID=UPI000D587F0C|nr:helix-turn-helix domain-containing protein [Chryseobacterium sp. HMWF035]PVV55081.1 transposase [Chryseobacterium sp. HMWF035]